MQCIKQPTIIQITYLYDFILLNSSIIRKYEGPGIYQDWKTAMWNDANICFDDMRRLCDQQVESLMSLMFPRD